MQLPPKGSLAWRRLMRYRQRELKRRYPNGKISPHFSYSEFFTHDGTPIPIKALPGIEKLIRDYLGPMRARFGSCTVLSGYRHRAYNRSIGGALHSQHIWDETPESVACDLRFAKGNPSEWSAYAKKLRAKHGRGGGIGTYTRSGFTHVDNRPYNADWSG